MTQTKPALPPIISGRTPEQFTVEWFDTYYYFLKFKSRDVPIVDLYGGAASGKSHAICHELVDRMYNESDIRILVTRKTGPSLEITTFQMIIDILTAMGKEERKDYYLNRSKGTKTLRVGNNVMWFTSMDDEQKKKSLNVNYIYIEEATEFSFDEFSQLDLRVRRVNVNGENQMLLSHNPVDEFHWTKTEVIDKADGKNIAVLKTTFKNNPRLPESAIRTLMRYKEIDEAFYQVYALGEYAVIQSRIFNNFFITSSLKQNAPIAYGLDFGYNNETALIAVIYYDGDLYLHELIYQKYMTMSDLIEKMKLEIPKHWRHIPIYGDASRPDEIEEISRAGFICLPADKNVKMGIDKVKRFKLYIPDFDVNLLREIRNYKWREDVRNNRVLDEPIKMNDHLMDALRYAVYTSEIEIAAEWGMNPKPAIPRPPSRGVRKKDTIPSFTVKRSASPGKVSRIPHIRR
jgi:phage terminase large subunit